MDAPLFLSAAVHFIMLAATFNAKVLSFEVSPRVLGTLRLVNVLGGHIHGTPRTKRPQLFATADQLKALRFCQQLTSTC